MYREMDPMRKLNDVDPKSVAYNNNHNILKCLSVELHSLFSYCHWRERPRLLANCEHRATTSSWRRLNDIAIKINPNTKYAQHANIWTYSLLEFSVLCFDVRKLVGTKSPKPIVANAMKQKYAASRKLQFSQAENIAAPTQM